MIKIKFKKLNNEAKKPEKKSSGAAGYDLFALPDKDIVIKPFKRVLIQTGISVEIPNGYEGQVRPRSGLALKNGITLLNSPGTIDSDYRGEIGLILINLSNEDFTVKKGMRLAQMLICPVIQTECVMSSELEETKRGKGGFGSTGV